MPQPSTNEAQKIQAFHKIEYPGRGFSRFGSDSEISVLQSAQSMASPTEDSESRFLERLFNSRRDLSLFIPFILGLTGTVTVGAEGAHGTPEDGGDRPDRIIVINPFTQGMIVIEGASGVDSLLGELQAKEGRPPASKASIDALPEVGIGGAAEAGECAICLEEWSAGGSAKEMPCRHSFHSECIEKWLGIHGSCPVCRFEMPLEDRDVGEKADGQGGAGEEEVGGRRRVRREVWVSFGFSGGRTNQGFSDPSSGGDDFIDPSSQSDST